MYSLPKVFETNSNMPARLFGRHRQLVLLAVHLVDASGLAVVLVDSLGQVVRRAVLHLARVEVDLRRETGREGS